MNFSLSANMSGFAQTVTYNTTEVLMYIAHADQLTAVHMHNHGM